MRVKPPQFCVACGVPDTLSNQREVVEEALASTEAIIFGWLVPVIVALKQGLMKVKVAVAVASHAVPPLCLALIVIVYC